jgi:hypothetical protein
MDGELSTTLGMTGRGGAWAAGNFTKTDEYLAERLREQSGQVDIARIAEFCSDFCAKYLPDARSIAEIPLY